MSRTCWASRCDRHATGWGLCEMHRKRIARTGRLHRPTPDERFMAHVSEAAGGCWQFAPANEDTGYGQFSETHETTVLAHRWSYGFFRGEIPEGLQLDHLCRNRACVNPDHLEPVTAQVNLLRGETNAAHNAAKEVCLHGHAFTPENTYMTPVGGRCCRACANRRRQEFEQRKRLASSRRTSLVAEGVTP